MSAGVTFEAIAKAVKAAGGSERLTRLGDGVFRFVDGDTKEWQMTTVHAPNLLKYTLEEWVEHWARLRANRKQPVRECNSCNWKGVTERMCGTVGPLCMECGDTTEVAA